MYEVKFKALLLWLKANKFFSFNMFNHMGILLAFG